MWRGPKQPRASSAISESCSGFWPSPVFASWSCVLCSCCCSIHSTSLLAFRPCSNACSSSPGLSEAKVRTTRGFRTFLFFCFITNIFSLTLGGLPLFFASSRCRISFATFICSSARTVSELFRSSNFRTSVPCSMKMERACWKIPDVSRSVHTSWSPACILTWQGILEDAVKLTLCTRIIISKSSKGSVPVMRSQRLQHPQSRRRHRQHCMMPQMAAMAMRGPTIIPHIPRESPTTDRTTSPIIAGSLSYV
mmetsp:Transcript_93658/g.248631  ORF Transcript_93658/g.248631 Transcript_93658/m.248631 type:complete len:251 (-) Transcript_93658:117-869(-)